MQNIKNKAFTLVELLVVITILAIISVVAYTSFGGVTDKALATRKISDISSIHNALVQYKVKNNYYPKLDNYDSDNNMWGYSGAVAATPSNKIIVTSTENIINTVTSASGGGNVYGSGTASTTLIGGKGTISQKTLGKQFLSEDLYDPELGDIKLTDGTLIDKGIGRYVYAIYNKKFDTNKKGTYYNLAYTTINEDEEYFTKISGDYDENVCHISSNCPPTLIGSGTISLVNKQKEDISVTSNNDVQGIPYAVTNFKN